MLLIMMIHRNQACDDIENSLCTICVTHISAKARDTWSKFELARQDSAVEHDRGKRYY